MFNVGGIMPFPIANKVVIICQMAVGAIEWPVTGFIDATGMLYANSPNTCLTAFVSLIS